MSLPESYLALRRGLLVRLAMGGAALAAVGGAAVWFAPGGTDDTSRVATTPISTSAADASPGAPSHGASTSARQGASAGETLADATGSVSALESLDGKALEVLGQRTADEVPATGDVASKGVAEDSKKSYVPPAKLPKGPHLQVGIYASPVNAEETRKKLEAAGYPVYLETRVHVGPFQNRKEADKAREKLKEQGTATLLIPQ